MKSLQKLFARSILDCKFWFSPAREGVSETQNADKEKKGRRELLIDIELWCCHHLNLQSQTKFPGLCDFSVDLQILCCIDVYLYGLQSNIWVWQELGIGTWEPGNKIIIGQELANVSLRKGEAYSWWDSVQKRSNCLDRCKSLHRNIHLWKIFRLTLQITFLSRQDV